MAASSGVAASGGEVSGEQTIVVFANAFLRGIKLCDYLLRVLLPIITFWYLSTLETAQYCQ